MICYRDMTFCRHYENCAHAAECHRPLTPKVVEAAERWWGSADAPIMTFAEQPHCHEQTSLNETENDDG